MSKVTDEIGLVYLKLEAEGHALASELKAALDHLVHFFAHDAAPAETVAVAPEMSEVPDHDAPAPAAVDESVYVEHVATAPVVVTPTATVPVVAE